MIGSVSSRFLLEVVILYVQIQTLVIAVPVPILVLNIILGMLKGGQTSSMHEIYIEETVTTVEHPAIRRLSVCTPPDTAGGEAEGPLRPTRLTLSPPQTPPSFPATSPSA